MMRKDLRIDIFAFGTMTVGGREVTDSIWGIVSVPDWRDIKVIMLSGWAIAWFKGVDPARLLAGNLHAGNRYLVRKPVWT